MKSPRVVTITKLCDCNMIRHPSATSLYIIEWSESSRNPDDPDAQHPRYSWFSLWGARDLRIRHCPISTHKKFTISYQSGITASRWVYLD